MTAATEQPPIDYYAAVRDGFMPTSLASSPWQRDAQNGVALGLLLSHTLELEMSPERERLANFILDIVRPVPSELTHVRWRETQGDAGSRLLTGTLEAEGVVGARVTARLVASDAISPLARPIHPMIPPPHATQRDVSQRSGLDVQLVRSPAPRQPADPVRLTAWVKVKAGITAKSRASALSTAIAAADIGAVCLQPFRSEWNFPNLDVAVHFSRRPHAGWIRVDSEASMLGNGAGVMDHRLSDSDGPFARAHQILFFTRRVGAAG